MLRRQMVDMSAAVSGLAPRDAVASLETAVRDLTARVDASRQEGVRESDLEPIERLLADNLHIAKQMRAAVELTQENRDHATSDLLIDLLDATEKRIWFLHEISQGGSNAK